MPSAFTYVIVDGVSVVVCEVRLRMNDGKLSADERSDGFAPQSAGDPAGNMLHQLRLLVTILTQLTQQPAPSHSQHTLN